MKLTTNVLLTLWNVRIHRFLIADGVISSGVCITLLMMPAVLSHMNPRGLRGESLSLVPRDFVNLRLVLRKDHPRYEQRTEKYFFHFVKLLLVC